MTRNPTVHQYRDHNNEHRARVVAANGEPLFVSSEGYKREQDLIISQELARQALNDAYYADPARFDAAMATRDVAPLGGILGIGALPVAGALAAFRDNQLMSVRDEAPQGALPNALLEAINRQRKG